MIAENSKYLNKYAWIEDFQEATKSKKEMQTSKVNFHVLRHMCNSWQVRYKDFYFPLTYVPTTI